MNDDAWLQQGVEGANCGNHVGLTYCEEQQQNVIHGHSTPNVATAEQTTLSEDDYTKCNPEYELVFLHPVCNSPLIKRTTLRDTKALSCISDIPYSYCSEGNLRK